MFDLLNVPRNSVLHVDLFENGSKNVYAAFVSNMYGLDIGFNPINNTRTMLFNVKKYNGPKELIFVSILRMKRNILNMFSY
jgi:hypothetical protein